MPAEDREKFIQTAKSHLLAFRLDTLREKLERPQRRHTVPPLLRDLKSQGR